MPVTVYKIENEPILHATFTGHITQPDIFDMYRKSAALMGDKKDVFYRIADFRQAETDMASILGIVRAAADTAPGSTKDPRIRGIMLGTNRWIKIGQSTLQQMGIGGAMPVFEKLGDALDYARVQIALANQ